MALIEPFRTELDMGTGTLQPLPPEQVIQRHLSEMHHMYYDEAALTRILEQEGDRLIYEVYPVQLPEEEGQVLYCTTIIHPGRVGQEFHMTKGHFHQKRDRAEVYLGIAGEGYLLLQTEDGTVRDVRMRSGTVAYVPPLWAHRTVNTGEEPFLFFAAWPGDAGHDYGTIEDLGFAKLLVERGGRATIAENPRYGNSSQ